MGERFFLSTMIKKLGVGNKVNIEFYGKLIGTLIPRPAHMTVKLNLDQTLAICVDSHMFTTIAGLCCGSHLHPLRILYGG